MKKKRFKKNQRKNESGCHIRYDGGKTRQNT